MKFEIFQLQSEIRPKHFRVSRIMLSLNYTSTRISKRYMVPLETLSLFSDECCLL